MKAIAGLALAAMVCVSQAAWACKPVHGHVYLGSTEAEKLARATVVFSGKVVRMRVAPKTDERYAHPGTRLYTFDVARWEKGGIAAQVEVADNFGTDCDSMLFITHLHIAPDAHLPSATWRVFAQEANGRLHVVNAELLK